MKPAPELGFCRDEIHEGHQFRDAEPNPARSVAP